MGSGEHLGTPEDPNTQESDTMNPNALEKSIDARVVEAVAIASTKAIVAVNGKRKRVVLADNEIHAFDNMTDTMKDVARAITDNKPTDMHPALYAIVMDIVGFAECHLMAVLSHLVDNKA